MRLSTSSPPELPGAQIGPYQLLEQIGEGGMGVVYLATQREPIRRKVALKVSGCRYATTTDGRHATTADGPWIVGSRHVASLRSLELLLCRVATPDFSRAF